MLADTGPRREAALARLHEMLVRIIDVIPRMVCVTGRDGRYLLVNRRFAAFVGARASRLIGQRPMEERDLTVAELAMFVCENRQAKAVEV